MLYYSLLSHSFYDNIGQAASSLRNWRSEIGKRALKAVSNIFIKQEPFRSSGDAIITHVKKVLVEGRFVYRDTEVRASHCILTALTLISPCQAKTGAFRSPILIEVFAYHLRIILKTPDVSYGNPKGALALCAVAVCCHFLTS